MRHVVTRQVEFQWFTLSLIMSVSLPGRLLIFLGSRRAHGGLVSRCSGLLGLSRATRTILGLGSCGGFGLNFFVF